MQEILSQLKTVFGGAIIMFVYIFIWLNLPLRQFGVKCIKN